ncbi:MAG: alanine racemase [Rhodobacteraceae bacterium]|nr:alanine racemase [Paracoccaceae bacterium]
MAHAQLTIDLGAVVRNWRRLDGLTPAGCETAATVKADAYGLGLVEVAKALADGGCRTFFVAMLGEALNLRKALGDGPMIGLLSGCMQGDAERIASAGICPMLLSVEQFNRYTEQCPGQHYGLQIETGMNRVGIDPVDLRSLDRTGIAENCRLMISHLADADDIDSEMNRCQLNAFLQATEGFTIPRSLAATGGILLGPDYHFDLCRPGIGLYGGDPFKDAEPTLTLALPVLQVRDIQSGQSVGYGGEWVAVSRARIATVLSGYSDGILRHLDGKLSLYADGVACPVIGRLSMDMMTVDITAHKTIPDHLQLINDRQTVNDIAGAAGTIVNEVLSGLSRRYDRIYVT